MENHLIETKHQSSMFYDNIIKKCNNCIRLTNTDLEYMKEWDKNISSYHEKRIMMIKCKHIYFLNYVNKLVNKLILKNNVDVSCYVPFLTSSINTADLTNKIREMTKHFNTWIENGNTFDENTEQKQKAVRVYAWSNYFKSVFAVLNTLEYSVRTLTPMYPSMILIVKLLTTIYNNNYSTVQPNTTPFTTKLSECLREWAEQEGITVNVIEKEHLNFICHEQTQTKTVNLFLPSHRSAIPDALVMGHLDLPHYILFGNPAMFGSVPETLKTLIASVPEFISVGKIKNNDNMTPIEKLIKSLDAGLGPDVLIYFHGFVPSAGEILPISPVSVDKCIAPLILNGYNVNIYPIAYEIESEFLLNRENHKGMVYTIKYGAPLKYNAVKELVRYQLGSVALKKENLDDLINGKLHGDGPKYIDHYLLTFWYDTITEHKELTIDELIERFNKRYGL